MTDSNTLPEQKTIEKKTNNEEKDIFSDIEYICGSSSLIVDSLQKGLDITQMPNGDVMTTEIKVINTQYSWNKEKNRMVKISQSH